MSPCERDSPAIEDGSHVDPSKSTSWIWTSIGACDSLYKHSYVSAQTRKAYVLS